jgi:peptide deformylase
MRVTMIEAPGVGLAATQIGLGLALAVVEDHVRDDDDDDPREAAEFPFHVIINPQLLRRLPELRRLSGGTQALARHHRPLAG